MRELAGQAPAAKAGAAHDFESERRWSPNARGRPTLASAVAACPAGTVMIVRSGAAAPMPVFPRAPTVASRRGENRSPAQSVAW